mgnify:CR=1 FL=1
MGVLSRTQKTLTEYSIYIRLHKDGVSRALVLQAVTRNNLTFAPCFFRVNQPPQSVASFFPKLQGKSDAGQGWNRLLFLVLRIRIFIQTTGKLTAVFVDKTNMEGKYWSDK